MKIWCFSDIHGFHRQLTIPKDIDGVIFAGDCSNQRNSAINFHEVNDFLLWFEEIKVSFKVFVAGNHETSIYHKLIDVKDYINIIYLEHKSYSWNFDNTESKIDFKRYSIFGSPYTPSLNNWAFQKDRSKLAPYWEEIPENLDILITHGPPKGILDLSRDKEDTLEFCGDKSLLNSVLKKEPRYHIFGHIHDSREIVNHGFRQIEKDGTIFINVSCVKDGNFSKGPVSNGVVIEI